MKEPPVSQAKNSRSKKVVMGPMGGGPEGTGRAGTAVIGERQTAGGVGGLDSMQLYSVFQPLYPSQTVTLPLSLSHTHT